MRQLRDKGGCRAVVFVVAVSLLSSCDRSELQDVAEYTTWIADSSNGVAVEHQIGGIKLRAMLLPGDYLAHMYLRDHEQRKSLIADSIDHTFGKSLCFMVSATAADGDVLMQSVRNEEQLSERVLRLNFSMQEFFSLRFDGRDIRPAIAMLENSHGIGPSRSILLVFPRPALRSDSEPIRLTFDDRVFMTGINHFDFTASAILAVPRLELQRD